MFKKISVLFALVLGIVFVLPTQQVAATAGDVFVDIHGPASNLDAVYDGSSFQVDVVAEDISDTNGLGGAQYILEYDDILTLHTGTINPDVGNDLSGNDCLFEHSDAAAGAGKRQISVSFACSMPLAIAATPVILGTFVFEQPSLQGTDFPIAFEIIDGVADDLALFEGADPFDEIDSAVQGLVTNGTIVSGDCGDVNRSSSVNTSDALATLFFAVTGLPALDDAEQVLADVVRDNDVNVGDVSAILQNIVGATPLDSCGPIDPLA